MLRDIPSSAFLRTFTQAVAPKVRASAMASPPALPAISLGKVSVPVDLSYLRMVQSCTADIARMLSFEESQIVMLQLAVEEGFTNAVQHFSRTPGVDENVHVEFRSDGGNFVVAIRDRGMPFDIDEMESYTACDTPDIDIPGLGLTLMKSSVDKVEIITAGRDGKELRLLKRLPAGVILPEGLLRAGRQDLSSGKRKLKLDEIPVRFPSNADLHSIRRLAWLCHGYDYASLFYDIGRLREMLSSRLYLPVIAADPMSGEAVYHVALMLDHPEDVVPVEGMEFNDPEADCAGLPRKAALILHEIAKRRGFLGVRIHTAAGNNPAQRKVAEILRTNPCAVLMANHADTSAASSASTRAANSALVHFSPMDASSSTVHLPERHASMAEEIYRWLGLPRTISTGREAPVPKTSEVACVTDKDSGHAVIRAASVGMDTVEKIHTHLNTVRSSGSSVVSVWLAADSPASCDVALWCEKVGMSFAGIVPMYFGGRDALVMQWIGVPLDFGGLSIYGERNQRLFDYVKSCLGY